MVDELARIVARVRQASAVATAGTVAAGARRSRWTMEESVAPIEDHGFSGHRRFLPDRIVLRQFRWDVDRQPVEAIDTLEAFHTTELPVPG